MTIPPIGPVPGSPAQPEERANGTERPESRRVESMERESEAARAQGAERVEFSADAEKIRERQTEITRMQIAERTARAIERDMREIDEMVARRAEAARSGGRIDTPDAEEYIERLRSRADEARYGDENLLDGREMKFRVREQERTVRTPDAGKLIEKHIKEARQAVRERREIRDTESNERIRRYIEEVRDARLGLEREVRESVEKAMRESSTSRPRDVNDAERLLRKARSNYGDSQRTSAHDQLTGKTVNLLQ